MTDMLFSYFYLSIFCFKIEISRVNWYYLLEVVKLALLFERSREPVELLHEVEEYKLLFEPCLPASRLSRTEIYVILSSRLQKLSLQRFAGRCFRIYAFQDLSLLDSNTHSKNMKYLGLPVCHRQGSACPAYGRRGEVRASRWHRCGAGVETAPK